MICDNDGETTAREIRRKGLRMTPLKREVVDLFEAGACGVSAGEVHRMITTGSDLSAVYRCLSSLVAAGFLRECPSGDGVRRFRPAGHWDDRHDHLSCAVCGRVVRVPADVSEPVRRRLEAMYGFSVRHLDLSGEGVCPVCRGRHEEES
jgi:Fe2+ or Zn2+ uptake regulation protein